MDSTRWHDANQERHGAETTTSSPSNKKKSLRIVLSHIILHYHRAQETCQLTLMLKFRVSANANGHTSAAIIVHRNYKLKVYDARYVMLTNPFCIRMPPNARLASILIRTQRWLNRFVPYYIVSHRSRDSWAKKRWAGRRTSSSWRLKGRPFIAMTIPSASSGKGGVCAILIRSLFRRFKSNDTSNHRLRTFTPSRQIACRCV